MDFDAIMYLCLLLRMRSLYNTSLFFSAGFNKGHYNFR